MNREKALLELARMAVKNERYKKRDVGNNGARSFQIKHFLLSKPPTKFYQDKKTPIVLTLNTEEKIENCVLGKNFLFLMKYR